MRFILGILLAACGDPRHAPIDPATAPRAAIDRFSDEAGTVFRRSVRATLPGPDQPIDFDREPFLLRGLGPAGEPVEYYNFDVRTRLAQPFRLLYRQGDGVRIRQGAIVNVIPGDPHYTDIWQVVRVYVPDDTPPNAITSVEQIFDGAYREEHTNRLINCPVVPAGSTATRRLGADAELSQGWYRGKVVSYFSYEEAFETDPNGAVPVADLFVTFNTNGDRTSGYVREPGTPQTHNVLAALPSDPGYSPLWTIVVYDNSAFAAVTNLAAARSAPVIHPNLFILNAPVVALLPAP